MVAHGSEFISFILFLYILSGDLKYAADLPWKCLIFSAKEMGCRALLGIAMHSPLCPGASYSWGHRRTMQPLPWWPGTLLGLLMHCPVPTWLTCKSTFSQGPTIPTSLAQLLCPLSVERTWNLWVERIQVQAPALALLYILGFPKSHFGSLSLIYTCR